MPQGRGCCILNKLLRRGLIEKVILEQRFMEVKDSVIRLSEERVFQAEGNACAETLWCELVWYIKGTVRWPIWQEWSEAKIKW